MTKVQRTYGSSNRNKPTFTPSSPPSSLSSSPPLQESRKRSFEHSFSLSNKAPSTKRLKVSSVKPENKSKQERKQKNLTQLHLCFNQTIIKTCALCGLSYTKGVEEDEVLHKKHCLRMQKGTEWGKEEEKEGMKVGVQEIASGLKLKGGKKGRIICVNANVKGKVGSKV
jgi:N-acetyltransferase